MSTFEYTALDGRGRTRKGVEEGDSPREVRDRLREQGLTPLTLQEIHKGNTHPQSSLFSPTRGIGGAELTLATRQLATLLKAALPVEEALNTVSQQTDHKKLRVILLAVRARVLEGRSLATALDDYPDLFNDLYRETIAAGESSGQLDQVLERLANHLEKSRKLKSGVGLALIYPAVVVFFSLLVAGALVTYVVPEVTRVFEDFGQDLPPLTRGLIALSEFLRHYGAWLLVGLFAAVVAMRALLRREGPKRAWHRLHLRLPIVAALTRGIHTARFARTLGILTGSGVPILEGLRIAARGVGNLPMREAVNRAAERVREGGTVHQALAESRIFSPLVVHLIASGEASGNLANMLDRAAEAQEQEVESLVGVLTGMLEPLLIFLMGGMVLTIVVAILLPIFNLNQLIQ
ncbi:Type II secretion system protein F [Candidatus Magnetaquicoccaceae bacterium FCR-1]|uniref:Type II secretion system protein F n=1 Tax=Candidatus Magnetaquiglobus chichijimensis TaxID=3141448 RepID=A0ABQ0C5S4_9PROT